MRMKECSKYLFLACVGEGFRLVSVSVAVRQVRLLSTLLEYYPHSLPPTLVNPYQYPLNLRRHVPQQRIGCRVYVQCGRHQKQQGLPV